MKTDWDAAAFAQRIRELTVRMVSRSGSSHVGSALSLADIVAVLYAEIAHVDPRDPGLPERDRVILSKGHACSIIYAALAARGFIAEEELDEYAQPGSRLLAHISHRVPGVEFSTGSLGHGLPFGVGKANAARLSAQPWHTFVLLGDGEMDEGSNWESLLFAAHARLSNLTAVIDANNLQSLTTVGETLGLEPLPDKLRAFGADVVEGDGHDLEFLREALRPAADAQRFDRGPRVVIARTIKGKGVSYMENSVAWHYKSPNPQELDQALAEIGGGRA
ncbi:transketolase [Microbacterium laevaniformans]|uniref:transketolase n=1 Tax=Microbacterium laevaniformans TaxID=36807 RepID=UPI0019582630|nr:transketolase [Microbacterium laevaniformans]GLJ63867.1 transketolase [Microbacterium laevaniformans]